MKSPKISAYNIHEWVYTKLQLPEDDISMLQIDGPRRKVYIKFVSSESMQIHLRNIQGVHEYKHENGEMSLVEVSVVG
jgi:hypothetical protein